MPTEGVHYDMTITEVSKHRDGYAIKAEIEESLFATNSIRFCVPKEVIRYFPVGDTISITVSFGVPVLNGK